MYLFKTKTTRYGDEVYTKFGGLNMPEDGVECESFITISIDSLLFLRINVTYNYI